MQIPAGLLLDRLGARISLTGAVFISAAGVTMFGLAHSLFAAGLARLLIGFGSAFSFISALFLVARWFSHKRFALVAGLTQLAGCLGSICGLAPVAILIYHYGWHQTMITTGILTFGLGLLFWLFIRDGKKPKHLTKPLETKVSLSAFNYIRRQPQIWWISCCGLLSWMPVAAIGALWGTVYIAKVYHIDIPTAGKLCSLFWIGLAIGSPAIGWLSNHINRRCLPMSLAFIMGLIAALLLIEAPYLPLWITGFTLFMLGTSASVQALTFGAIKDIVPADIFATVSGLNNMAAIIGGTIAQMGVGFLLTWLWHGKIINKVPIYSINNYRLAFIILIVGAILGFLVAQFKVKETYCQITDCNQ